jgi:putative transposase
MHIQKGVSLVSSLTHTKWECKYHVVFIPKYRRKVLYGECRREIGRILRQLCEYKGIEIIEATAAVDHIHMLIRIPPKYSVSNIMGYLKGKSALMIFERLESLRYKFGNRHFWARGYFVSTVGLDEEVVKRYIKEQETADKLSDS